MSESTRFLDAVDRWKLAVAEAVYDIEAWREREKERIYCGPWPDPPEKLFRDSHYITAYLAQHSLDTRPILALYQYAQTWYQDHSAAETLSSESLYRLMDQAVMVLDAATWPLFSCSETTPPAAPTYLGKGVVDLGTEKITLEERERYVVEVLLTGPKTLSCLRAESLVDDANRVMSKVRENYPALQAHLIAPGGRGRGGYRTTIIDGR